MTNRSIKLQRGFTLIEMTVVITILAVMAAAIMPNMVAVKQSRELRQLEWELQRMPAQARDEAQRRNARVMLLVDGDDLVLSQVPAEGEDPIEIKRLPLGQNLRVDAIRKNREAADSGDWKWTAYPDGSSEGAYISVVEGDKTKSLAVAADGGARWNTDDDENSEDQDERWQAGDAELRGQQ